MATGDLPEYYTDQFLVTFSVFGATMTFGLSSPHPSPGQNPPPENLVRIRMSLEHAKVMAMLMKRQLKAYEDNSGATINIPRQVYNGMGLSQEDW